MSSTTTPKNDSAQTDDVAVDVAANDLVHIGLDSQGYNHYYDRQRERVVVTSETHDQYTRDGSAIVRRSLVASASTVDDIIPAGDDDIQDYVTFVDQRVDDRSWDSIIVDFIDARKLLGDAAEVAE